MLHPLLTYLKCNWLTIQCFSGNAASSAVKTPAGKKAKGDGYDSPLHRFDSRAQILTASYSSVDPSPAPKKGRAKLKPKAEIDSDEEGTPLTQRYRKMKRKTEDSDEEGTPLTKKFRKVLDEEHENIKTEQDEEV
jgi:hypothetical protein